MIQVDHPKQPLAEKHDAGAATLNMSRLDDEYSRQVLVSFAFSFMHPELWVLVSKMVSFKGCHIGCTRGRCSL